MPEITLLLCGCSFIISIGSRNHSIDHPGEVFKTAFISSTAAILRINQHPSGDPTLSGEDLAIIRRFKEAG